MKCLVVVALIAALAPGAAAADDPPLVRAARAGDAQTVSRLLQQRTDVNAAAIDGTTALHWAVRADDLDDGRHADSRRRQRQGIRAVTA